MSGRAYPPLGYAAYVTCILMFASVVAFLDRQILALLVTHVQQDLALDDVQISLLQGTAFAFFYGAVSLPVGHLVDRSNRRRIILIGIIFWSVMTICCALADNFVELFIARAGVGLGEACLGPAAISIIADYFAPDRRGRALAVYQAGASIGVGTSMLIGGVILAAIGDASTVQVPLVGEVTTWKMIFAIIGSIGLAFAPLLLTVREPVRKERAAPTRAEADNRPASPGFWSFARRHRSLVGPIYLIYIFATCYGSALSAWAATFYVREFAMLPSRSGLVAGGAIAVSGLIGCTLAGVVGDRLSRSTLRGKRSNVMIIAWCLALPGVLLFPFATSEIASVLLLGLAIMANTMLMASAPAVISDVLPNDLRGVGAAIYFINIAIFGIALGPFVVAAVNEAMFAADGLRPALLVTTVPMVIAGLATSFFVRGRYPASAAV